MQIMGRKRFWPFDSAITIAVIALIVSIAQLICTTPLLLDLYFKPVLVATNVKYHGSKNNVVAFSVHNEGSREAEMVELGIVTGENDTLTVMPDLGSMITHDNSVWVRNHRVIVPYLSPEEGFNVLIRVDPKSPRNTNGNLKYESNAEVVSTSIPAITYFRSKSGRGKILANKFDIKIIRN